MSLSMTKVGNWNVNTEVHLTRQGKEGWWLSSTWLLQSFSSFSSTSTSSSTIVILILILHFNTGVSDFLCVKIPFLLLWKSVTHEFYKGILLRAAMASRGIFRNTPVICFGLSSIPSMTHKRRKVLILQVIQQMTDRTHQMENNPLIPVLLFHLTVQIY